VNAITYSHPGEFVFPCERILGRIPGLHPKTEDDDFEFHRQEIAEAKARCREWNLRFSPNTETKNHRRKN
jgi:hypothetical protein